MYKHLGEEKLLLHKQKGCRRQKRGPKDQLLLDKMVIQNYRRRLTNLATGWIDYKKAYDMIPQLNSEVLEDVWYYIKYYSNNGKGNGEMECRSGGWEWEIGKYTY